MPRPVSLTENFTPRALAREADADAAALGRELHRVRQKVPRAPVAGAPGRPRRSCRRGSHSYVSWMPLALAAGRTTSMESETTSSSSTSRVSSRSLPEMMRERSSRSSMSLRLHLRVALDGLQSLRLHLAAAPAPARIRFVQPMMEVSGVRSSCESVERNSSFRRFAASASARAAVLAQEQSSRARPRSLQLAQVARKLFDVRLGVLDVLQVGQVREVDDGDDRERRQHRVEADRLDEPRRHPGGRSAREVGHRSPEVVGLPRRPEALAELQRLLDGDEAGVGRVLHERHDEDGERAPCGE